MCPLPCGVLVDCRCARRWLTDRWERWTVSSRWWASRRWQGWRRVAIYFKWNSDGNNYSGSAMAYLQPRHSWLAPFKKREITIGAASGVASATQLLWLVTYVGGTSMTWSCRNVLIFAAASILQLWRLCDDNGSSQWAGGSLRCYLRRLFGLV